jgi:hypothetical protein
MAERNARRATVKAMPTQELLQQLPARTDTIFNLMEALPTDDVMRPLVPMAAGLTPIFQVAQLRLNELALHQWDVLIPRDPTATMNADAAGLLLDYALEGAPRQADKEMLVGLEAVYACDTHGPGGGPVGIVCHNGAIELARGTADDPSATIHLAVEALIRLTWGRLPLEAALAQETVRIDGDRDLVLALGAAFGNRETLT